MKFNQRICYFLCVYINLAPAMFGTELNSAYAPFNSDNEVISPFLQDSANVGMDFTGGSRGMSSSGSSSHNIIHKSTPIANLSQHQQGPMTEVQPQFQSPIISAAPQQLPSSQQLNMMAMQAPTPGAPQDPRIALLVNELKKQQKLTASMQQQSGYLDKLFSKKKDLLRIIQFSLIIVLAMSLHFVIDHYIKYYIKNNDFTFERELIIRLVYPVAVIFILWNMKAFLK